jgi:hypothetical protein
VSLKEPLNEPEIEVEERRKASESELDHLLPPALDLEWYYLFRKPFGQLDGSLLDSRLDESFSDI